MLRKYVRQLNPIQENKVVPIDKVQSLLSESLKAEDYEAAIVMGWYELHNKELDNNSGIPQKIVDTINSNPDAKASGKRIAEYILKNKKDLSGAQAEQYGRASTKLTSFWTSFGATNKTPKTDILIGNARFSLKIGMAQLMSGGQSESMATFNAALKTSDQSLSQTPQFKKVSGIIESFVTASVAPGQLRAIIKKGDNDVVNQGEAAHKQCMSEMSSLFQQSNEFKIAFAREAMSGFEKFGKDALAAAEFMLVASHDGTKVAIHSVYDDAYCEKIATKMKLQARFKTSSRKIKKVKTGEYNFWSVISLIVNAMDESFYENGNMLTEANILMKMLKGVKSFLSKTWKKVTTFFKSSASNLMKFLGAEVDIKANDYVDFN